MLDTWALPLLLALQFSAPTISFEISNKVTNLISKTDDRTTKSGAFGKVESTESVAKLRKALLHEEDESFLIQAGEESSAAAYRRPPPPPPRGRGRRPPPRKESSSEESDSSSDSSSSEEERPTRRPPPRPRRPPPPRPPPQRRGRGRRSEVEDGSQFVLDDAIQNEIDEVLLDEDKHQILRSRRRRDAKDGVSDVPPEENSVDVGNRTETPMKNSTLAGKHPEGKIPTKAGCYGRRHYPPPPPPREYDDDDEDSERIRMPRYPRGRRGRRARPNRGKRSVSGQVEEQSDTVPERSKREASPRSSATSSSSSSSSSGAWKISASTIRTRGGATAVAMASVDDGHGHVKKVRSSEGVSATMSGGDRSVKASASAGASPRTVIGHRMGRQPSSWKRKTARGERRFLFQPLQENTLSSTPVGVKSINLSKQNSKLFHDTLETRPAGDDNTIHVSKLSVLPRDHAGFTDSVPHRLLYRKKREAQNSLWDDEMNGPQGVRIEGKNIFDFSKRELVKRCAIGSGGTAGTEIAREGIRAGREAIRGGVEVAKLLVQAFRDLGTASSSSRRKRDLLDNMKKNLKDKMDVVMSKVNEHVMDANEKLDNRFGDNPTYVKGKEQLMEGLGQVIQAAMKLSASSEGEGEGEEESSRRRRDTAQDSDDKSRPTSGMEAILARILADMDNIPGSRRAKLVAVSQEREELMDPIPESSSESESPLRAKRQAREFYLGSMGDARGMTTTNMPSELLSDAKIRQESDEVTSPRSAASGLASELGFARRRREARGNNRSRRDLKEMRGKMIQKGRELVQMAKQAIARTMSQHDDVGTLGDDDADSFEDDIPVSGLKPHIPDDIIDDNTLKTERLPDDELKTTSQPPNESEAPEQESNINNMTGNLNSVKLSRDGEEISTAVPITELTHVPPANGSSPLHTTSIMPRVEAESDEESTTRYDFFEEKSAVPTPETKIKETTSLPNDKE